MDAVQSHEYVKVLCTQVNAHHLLSFSRFYGKSTGHHNGQVNKMLGLLSITVTFQSKKIVAHFWRVTIISDFLPLCFSDSPCCTCCPS